MKDVARRAGVGLATVSRVVNGDSRVSEHNRLAVEEAIEELNFRRNDSARLLRTGSAASVGLVLDDMADPYFSALSRAVERTAIGRTTVSVAASSENDAVHGADLIHALCARRLDGLIVAPPRMLDESLLQEEIRSGTPMVFVDRAPQTFAADAVVSDNHGGAADGVSHLICRGHRRIACLSDQSELSTVLQRAAAYRAALQEVGIEANPRWEHAEGRGGVSSAEWLASLCALPEDERPTALFCTNSKASITALRVMKEAGLSLGRPGFPALVCFDDFELADVIEPGITVVAQDPGEVGRTAADLLFSRLDGSNEPARTVTVPTRLIVRGSGEVPPPA
ncbi:LacI family DNA-binding transcriptional regulator [Psychromicrobium xiongbiense]|uniref:LacI family DNA-binding transcriptional regulator n=1 Tax=Psychromicrobium xiongbiense TaxID=3051184 RepID=UPI0025529BFB|nr:LacI family DNA-binding transcriptional regulator [Psychromicrobium sp. YIM S02556]